MKLLLLEFFGGMFLTGSPGLGQRKGKGGKAGCASSSFAPCNARYSNGVTVANGGLTLCDPVTGTQYVQIQLLQVNSLLALNSISTD